ncbi:SDR family NAD(P)-dependent oxidoreductase [Cupriavidus agavae]|uniref:NAD(P)-dependent dehydrogenase (Short-subunit alcohol dehydrogenase family) n=1 Tax=Cupriavidus agavae TaxID=1001822 RepID=A0A4Q7RZ42_9BURK|nr:SDR family oxidoreductase [Cupriavidus agavae]RZT39123.1 NAD(P)-dependent dehydrogenase (short-subunit alcohol dehydrogenase family) [Cupriavidus agavae]
MIALPTFGGFRLDGKRALVTGGGRGLGLAAGVALAQAGAAVTLAARSGAELEAACAAIRAQDGKADVMVLDVTDARNVAREIASRAPYQILVNNAGMNRPRLLTETPDDDIDAVFTLNVKATFYLCREVARSLQAAGLPGSIINVSSQMGHVGSPRRTLYCASKHAVEGMTKALAWELGPAGIRVNTLCPTFIETALTAPMFEDRSFRSFVLDRIALGRLGRIDEVMGPMVFLASDASSLMTGSALMLDGGWTAA